MDKIKKVLVLGAGGMLGDAVYKQLSKNPKFHVVGTFSKAVTANGKVFRVTEEGLIEDLRDLLEANFDFIVNCIWIIRPGGSAESARTAFLVNSYFPKILRQIASVFWSRVIHVSTDCVFNWKKGGYLPDDLPDETGVYWMSKMLWEDKVPPHLTIRTSIIWIESEWNHRNLLSWFLQNPNHATIKGFNRVFWNGLTTVGLSKIIERIIEADMLSNIWFMQLGSAKISKYELLVLARKVFEKDLEIIPDPSVESDKTIVGSEEQSLFEDIIEDHVSMLTDLRAFYA